MWLWRHSVLVNVITADLVSLQERCLYGVSLLSPVLWGWSWARSEQLARRTVYLASVSPPPSFMPLVIEGICRNCSNVCINDQPLLHQPPYLRLYLFRRKFLHLKPPGSAANQLRHYDWPGSLMLLVSLFLTLYAITSGGALHPWGSIEIVLPLSVGTCGIIAFLVYERSFARNPMVL